MPTAATVSTADIRRITIALNHSASSVAKGADIVNAGLVYTTDLPGTYLVRSVTDENVYYVTTLTSCTCDSHRYRGHCKHQTAILVRLLAAQGA